MNLIDFEYNGRNLSDFGMMPFSSDTKDESTIGNALSMGEVKAAYRDSYIPVGATYTDSFNPTIEICKNPCDGDDQYELTDAEINELVSWLNRKSYYKFSPIYDDGSFSGVYFMCSFNVTALTAGSKVIGLSLEMLSSSPYGNLPEVVLTGSQMDSVSITDTSNEFGHINLDMELTLQSAGNLIITNSMEPGRSTVIRNCTAGEVITISGSMMQIRSSSHVKLGNDFNYKFPRIVKNDSGVLNTFSFSIPCSYTIRYTPIMKVGLIV